MISFVWAFLPFKFAMTVYPAIVEMQAASCLCKTELLCDSDDDTKHADVEVASAESCLKRVMAHVAAAGITSGRSSEVYGIVMPVQAPRSIGQAIAPLGSFFTLLMKFPFTDQRRF